MTYLVLMHQINFPSKSYKSNMQTKLKMKFHALWRKAIEISSLSDLDPKMVRDWACQIGLDVIDVTESDVGAFQTTRAIVLKVEGGTACLPKSFIRHDERWNKNRKCADDIAALWEKVEWFCPLWIPQGQLQPLLEDIQNCSNERAADLFDYHMSTVYTLPFQAVCIAQLLPHARSLAEFAPLVREAYLAFYSGHKASSIAALIPVMEGAIKKIARANPKSKVLDEIDRVIDRASSLAAHMHFDGMWVPAEYLTIEYLFGQDERIFIFESYRRWLHKTFFQDSEKYDGTTWLNRHVFAHGVSSDWQQGSNFSRLVVALATLGVIESWHDNSNQVSLFFPDMNDDGELLWQQALLRVNIQMMLLTHEQEKFQQYGRLVPELPTDDGITLRKAVLMDDCINDLVRPLRDAGWAVKVDDPDEQALFITVVASSGSETFTVALLYSCATDNQLYRELATKAIAILYRGGPYHQESYAYGINVHVGPVNGWQPPLASHE